MKKLALVNMLYFVLLLFSNLLSAGPSVQIGNQIIQTISNQVNENISERMIEREVRKELVALDKRVSDRSRIQEAQKMLTRLGYQPGVADGIAGKKTKKAIHSFLKDNGVHGDGVLTEKLHWIVESSQ